MASKQLVAHLHLIRHSFVGWLLDEPHNPAIDATLHDAELGNLMPMARLGS
jgi:hypothetical protein